MKTYILLGVQAVKHFFENEFAEIENLIKDNNADLISWNKDAESVSTLLDQLHGWNNFVELTTEDLENFKKYTKIEIL